MSTPLIDRYKIPLLGSIVIALAIFVFDGQGYWLNGILSLVGAVIGVLLIDFEYIIHAFIVDPSSDVSMRIRTYLSAHEYRGLIAFYNQDEYSFGEVSIRSVMFQIILTLACFIAVTSPTWVLAKGLVLSMSLTLLYFQFQEFHKTHTLQRWFWVYKGTLSAGFYKFYMLVLLLILVYQLVFL